MPAGLLVTEPDPEPSSTTESGCIVVELKAAPTDRAESIVTWQLPVPLQAPVQPANAEPAFGVAVNATTVPMLNEALHVGTQLIPDGLLDTPPPPVPPIDTVSVRIALNFAVTSRAWSTVTTHVGVLPVQAPPQPMNAEPWCGAAVSVTCMGEGYVALQVAPQLMAPELPLTKPVPEPPLITASTFEVMLTPLVYMPRPIVAATSVALFFQNSCVTRVLTGPSLAGDQLTPPFSLAKIPASVPT